MSEEAIIPFRRPAPARSAAPIRKPMPHSLEAEAYLISCCLMDAADMLPRCLAARLSAASFYLSAHGIIYERMLDLYNRQIPVDVSVIAEDLAASKRLDEVGGYQFLTQVSSLIPTTAQAGFFLERVRTLWILREIITHGTALVEEVFNYSGEPLVDFLSPHVVWFENALARLAHGGRGDVHTLEKRIAEVREDVAKRAAGTEDRSRWVYTGFSTFDDVERERCLRPFNSLEEDGIVLVGGWSSYGKSVLMRQWAGEALRRGQMVLVYTLETSVKGFIRSLAASWAGVDLLQLHRTPKDLIVKFDGYCAELAALANKRLFVFQNEQGSEIATAEDFTRHGRRFIMQHGVPHLVVMDYLQRLDTRKRYNSGEQRVAFVSRECQNFQREYEFCLLGGAQLNEAGRAEVNRVERDKEGKVIHKLPNRGMLRESQALYHDADVVELLHRPVVNTDGTEQPLESLSPEMWIVQDKRRNGILGVTKTIFEKRFLRFREMGADDSRMPAAQKMPVTASGPGAPKFISKAQAKGVVKS